MLLFLLPSFLGLLRLGLVNGSGGDKGDLLLVFLWHVHPEKEDMTLKSILVKSSGDMA